MGVDLAPIAVRTPIRLEHLRGRTLVVDGNVTLYEFLSILRLRDGSPLTDGRGRVTSHLGGIAFRTTRLISDYGIRLVFVFDGPPPDLKRREIERRREAKERARREYEEARTAGDLATAWSKAVLSSRVTRDLVEEAKTLLGLLGIPVVQAPEEGEAQAAELVRRGRGWAAATKDYDALLFGSPRTVRFLAIGSREFLPSRGRSRRVPPELIDLEHTLTTLGLSREQLIDAAILIGTDFNEGVRGVGPKRAVQLLRRHGDLEHLPDAVRDALPENVDAVRNYFRFPNVDPSVRIDAPTPDADGVVRFLCDERSFARDRVEVIVRRLREARAVSQLDDFA